MKSLRTQSGALLALMAIILCAGPTYAQSEEGAIRTFDLKFGGGTAVDYINAVRRAAGDVNIVVMEDVDRFRMQPVELKRVTTEAAMRLLNGLDQQHDDVSILLGVDFMPVTAPPNWLFTVTASVRPTSRPPQMMSHVWSLTRILKSSLQVEDVLTAIETSLDLFGGAYEPAEMRFHKETGLLIARGHPEQVQAIETVIERLVDSLHQPDDRRQLEEFQMEASLRIHKLEEQLAESEERFITVRREAIEWQTKAELYLGQIDALEQELRAKRLELEGRIEQERSFKSEIDRLSREIEDLKRDGGGRKQQ